MIKRFLPNQDTFIFGAISNDGTAITGSSGDTRCAGKDEILELGNCGYSTPGNALAARMLIGIDSTKLQAALVNAPADGIKATLHYFLASSEGLPETYSVECYLISEQWDEGTVRSYDIVSNPNGATWKFRKPGQEWSVPGGSLAEHFSTVTLKTVPVRQDLQIDVTEIIALSSQGILLTLGSEKEMIDQGVGLKYFSLDTHTIYKPYLQVEWDDSTYDTELTTIPDTNFIVKTNVKPEYRMGDIVPVQVSVVPLYPSRVFSTSSIYRNEYVLPEESYWGIKDEYTNEMVVDFSEGTKISAGELGSYFRLDTGMFEPERFYRLLIQVQTREGDIVTLDNKEVFKVVRNGRY